MNRQNQLEPFVQADFLAFIIILKKSEQIQIK